MHHIDGDCTNNKIENLQFVSVIEEAEIVRDIFSE